MISAVKSSLSKKQQLIEVLFDPVPNLDEVAYGTVNNQKLRKEVAANLKVILLYLILHYSYVSFNFHLVFISFFLFFHTHIRKQLFSLLHLSQVPDYACNRGGPSTLEWANIYWANRLVAALGVKNAGIYF